MGQGTTRRLSLLEQPSLRVVHRIQNFSHVYTQFCKIRLTFDLTLGEKRGRAMPKKKTGARKKAEKQKQRQKDIKAAADSKSIVQRPCNSQMVGSTSGVSYICT